MTAQLENFTHNSTEFLRREQELLLHGLGAPAWPPGSRADPSWWWSPVPTSRPS